MEQLVLALKAIPRTILQLLLAGCLLTLGYYARAEAQEHVAQDQKQTERLDKIDQQLLVLTTNVNTLAENEKAQAERGEQRRAEFMELNKQLQQAIALIRVHLDETRKTR